MTIITCQKYGGQAYGGRATLDFDEDQAAFLRAQLDKDEAFQRRMKIAAIVAGTLLCAGGVVTVGLCFTPIIPYGLTNVLAIIGGTSTTCLSTAGLAFVSLNLDPNNDNDDDFISFATSLPVCRRLKNQFNNKQPITSQKSWVYLTKYHEEYLQKIKKQAQESLLERIPVKDLTNIVLDYLND